MTKFLNPELAASKTSRKKRQEAPRSSDSAGTERAMATLRRALEKQTKKADNQDRLRAEAINATMPEFIAALDEETLAPFFSALERLATAANRRRIATHPLRPGVVDEMHEEADEEEAEAALEAEKPAAVSSHSKRGQDADGEASPDTVSTDGRAAAIRSNGRVPRRLLPTDGGEDLRFRQSPKRAPATKKASLAGGFLRSRSHKTTKMRHPTAKLPKKVVIACKRKGAAAGRKNARSIQQRDCRCMARWIA